jgi:hypothetical protein
MGEQDPELEAFSKFIVAIEPWLGEVVLVGGWARRSYRLDPRARKLDYLPLFRMRPRHSRRLGVITSCCRVTVLRRREPLRRSAIDKGSSGFHTT